jgi:Outer membrane protein beta-barrel domain
LADRLVMKRVVLGALAGLLFVACCPTPAWADATGFWGFTSTPTRRTAKGFAVGISLLVVGFEYEYSKTSEDEINAAPEVTSHMGNILLQTPSGRGQLYFTAGGGFYQETYRDFKTDGFGTNFGGGIKITIAGPLRLRVDYRLFNLRGEPLYPHPRRFYAGAVISF